MQGIVHFDERSVEIRKSEIIDFEMGIRAGDNWRKFLSLLGWFIGEPVGDTKAV